MNDNQIFDYFTLVHFFGWFIVGMFIKRKLHLVFIIGLMWELFEYFVSHNEITRELLIKYWPVPQRLWEEKNILNKVLDMVVNMSGYSLGNMFSIHNK